MTFSPRLRRLLSDRRGLAGIEFALVFPIMVILLFGSFEVSQLLQVRRKVTNVAATASNLVAATNSINNSNMGDVFDASAAIMNPFSVSSLTIVVSSITNTNGVLAVDWSDAYHGQKRTTVPTNLPNGIVDPGSSIIMAETTYVYNTPTAQFFTSGVTFTDVFYDRPRRSLAVARCNC